MPTLISQEDAFSIVHELNELLLDQMYLTTNLKHVREMKQLLDKESENCLLNAIYTYATTAVWHGGEMSHDIPLFIDICEMELPQYLRACYAFTGSQDKFKKLRTLYELLHARLTLDEANHDLGVNAFWEHLPNASEGILSRRQVALLEGKKEDTIRNAAYALGDACLKPYKDNLYYASDVIRWQKAIGTFKSTTIRYGDLNIHNVTMLHSWLHDFCSPLSETPVSFEEIFSVITAERREAFSHFWQKPSEDALLSWFSTQNAVNLAVLLNVEPQWLVTQVYQCLLTELPESDELEELRQNREISSDTPTCAELIRQTLVNCNWVKYHPLQRDKRNTKMDGYTSGPVTFTHEHNLKTQFLWLPKSIGERISLPKKLYLKKELNLTGKYGRHSGLKKYTEIAYEDLYKVEVKTFGDLQTVLETLKS